MHPPFQLSPKPPSGPKTLRPLLQHCATPPGPFPILVEAKSPVLAFVRGSNDTPHTPSWFDTQPRPQSHQIQHAPPINTRNTAHCQLHNNMTRRATTCDYTSIQHHRAVVTKTSGVSTNDNNGWQAGWRDCLTDVVLVGVGTCVARAWHVVVGGSWLAARGSRLAGWPVVGLVTQHRKRRRRTK